MIKASYWMIGVWCVAFALLVANAAISFYNIEILTANEQAVGRSREVSRSLRVLLGSVVDAESAQRGYQITGETEYLVPFQNAEKEILELQRRLFKAIEGDEFHLNRFEMLKSLINAKFTELSESVRIRKSVDRERAREFIQAGHGKDLMDRIRTLADQMERHEEENLRENSRVAKERYQSASFTAVLGGSLTVVMVAMAFFLVRKELNRREQAERTLRESEQRFRTLTEAIPQLVWNCDSAGRITYVNRQWAAYTDMDVGNMPTLWWNQIAHPEDIQAIDIAWKQARFLHPEPFEVEMRLRNVHDGSYCWYQCSVVPLLRADGKVDQWIGALSSIDEQKRHSDILESLVRLRTQELESANELLQAEIGERSRAEEKANAISVELRRSNEDLEKFAYVASHDLQEPLRKIQSFGDRLVTTNYDSLNAKGQDYLERMKSAATRMRKLIEDLLSFSRVSSKGISFAPVDLAELVEGVLSDLEVSVTQTSATVELGPLPEIQADASQIRQLLQNLIGNALKFRKPDVPPHVIVRCSRWEELSPNADPPVPNGAGFRLEVADNGIGFDQSYADRVFEVFQRLHGRNEYDGTGIGLAICRKIVQRHGGRLDVRSRPNEGATFYADLPEQSQEDEHPSHDGLLTPATTTS